jgi:hypothetical protein
MPSEASLTTGSTARHSHKGRRMATFFAFDLGLAVTLGYHGRLTDDE